jgi:hypothetical protein
MIFIWPVEGFHLRELVLSTWKVVHYRVGRPSQVTPERLDFSRSSYDLVVWRIRTALSSRSTVGVDGHDHPRIAAVRVFRNP